MPYQHLSHISSGRSMWLTSCSRFNLLVHYVGINQNLKNSYKTQTSRTSHVMENLRKWNCRIKCFKIIISKHAGNKEMDKIKDSETPKEFTMI
jgi:hypothetical protein